MVNALGRCLVEPLNVRVRRARGETPVIANLRGAAKQFSEFGPDAVLQNETWFGGGQLNQTVAGERAAP